MQQFGGQLALVGLAGLIGRMVYGRSPWAESVSVMAIVFGGLIALAATRTNANDQG